MGAATMASPSTVYTRSPTRKSAMGRSPRGVAMGVSGDAHTGRAQWPASSHRQSPSLQTAMVSSQVMPGQELRSGAQAIPWLGMIPEQGHGDGASSQYQTGVPSGWPS